MDDDGGRHIRANLLDNQCKYDTNLGEAMFACVSAW